VGEKFGLGAGASEVLQAVDMLEVRRSTDDAGGDGVRVCDFIADESVAGGGGMEGDDGVTARGMSLQDGCTGLGGSYDGATVVLAWLCSATF
jgi:hypothetical protein